VGHSLGGIVIKQVGAPDHAKAVGSHGLLGAISSKDRATVSNDQRRDGRNYISGYTSPWKREGLVWRSPRKGCHKSDAQARASPG
jgi:hypothetical protein